MTRMLAVVLCAVLGAQVTTARGQESSPVVLQPFRASYAVTYRGIGAGSLDFTLRRLDGSRRYEYFSKPEPSLLAKIVISSSAIETSELEVIDGRVRPLRYRVEDGRRSTADDVRLDFDWDRQQAAGIEADQQVEIPLEPGMQDRMSIQIEVMLALTAGREPGTISMIDGDRVKHYTYTREGTERVSTRIGTFDAVIYSSTRPGSNRVARFWYAPELGYAPVRGHQVRKGKVETVMELTQFARLD